MQSRAHDIEDGFLDLDSRFEPTASLLPKSVRASIRGSRCPSHFPEVIELDEIPPIIKSTNGNLFWVDERCTRRVGLSSSEARFFLKLLNIGEPEDFIFDDYEAMFNRFSEEQKQLEDLLKGLSCWDFHTRQKRVWKARITFLQHMEDSRYTLIYMLGKRKRMLRNAATKVVKRFQQNVQDKRARSVSLQDVSSKRRRAGPSVQLEVQSVTDDSIKISEASVIISTQSTPSEAIVEATSEASGTSNAIFRIASRVRENFGSSLQKLTHSHTHNAKATAHFPIIGASREDIKHVVELILPRSTAYVVIGWFAHWDQDPQELTLQIDSPDKFFTILRAGERSVRGLRKYLSLKALRGFGLYKDAVLSQLYSAYVVSKRHNDTDSAKAWQGWVQKNLNDNKDNPLEGRYSLRLTYTWSSYRLATVVAGPLLLSLAIGSWYMMHGDVSTAWTLAGYILTAAALLIALMAVIGGLNDM